MIRDAVEDSMYLRAVRHLQAQDPEPRHPGRPVVSEIWMPTVDEVQRLSDQYYGPLKVTLHGRVLWHGSL